MLGIGRGGYKYIFTVQLEVIIEGPLYLFLFLEKRNTDCEYFVFL